MAADLKLDTATDIAVEYSDFQLTYDDDAIIQRLKLRLQDVRGNWFRNTEYGTDWVGAILGKRSDLTRRAELRRVILGTEGVAALSQLDLDFTASTRTLTVEFTCVKDDGQELDVRFENLL